MSLTTVLIVEDEAIVAADLEGKLRQLGYEVAGIAAEGEEAVALACRLRPDLVLMDIRLEGAMDGIDAAEAIRRQHDVPMIYLTAHSDAATLARAKLTGLFGYILKPFEERDLATQIELALYKSKSDRRVQQQNAILETINRIFHDALTCETEAQLGATCLKAAEELTQSKYGFIGEIDREGSLYDISISDPGWEVCAMDDQSGHRGTPIELKIHGLYGRVLLDGKSLLTNDPKSHPESIGMPPGHPVLTAFLGVPLILNGKTVGLVGLANREGGYGQDQLLAMEAIAPAIVEALMRKRAEASLIQSESRFRLLSETSSRLLASQDPQAIVKELCLHVMQHLDCHAFFNFLVDDTMGKLHLNACSGIPEEEARRIEWLDYGVAVCGCAARDAARIVAEDIFNVNDIRTELVKSYGIQAYACHPLMAQDRVIGTLSFGTKTRRHFSPRDLELMKTVTDQVAVAMERVRLMGELERSRDELEMRVSIRTAELATANDELTKIERELRRSEHRLRQNIELLQKVVDGITDPIFMLDKEGLVTTINKAAMDYFGATDDTDFFGRPCFLGLRGRENACPGCSYPFASVNKKPVTFERKGLIDPRKVESVTVYPVFNDFGERDAVIVKTSDVTQAKILERQIFHNEKLASLGLIASGIAHEINNPNSFIHFNIPILEKYLDELMPILDDYAALHPDFEVLHMSYADLKEDIYKLLENMAHGSQRINKIVGTLKSFVGKRDQEGLQTIDLKQLIDKVVALCHAEIRRTVKSFEVLVPGDLQPIVSDPEALEQVLLNILINAAHACDKEDSRMRLTVGRGRLGNNHFFIEISDNGTGIEETIQDRIFDPFFTTKSGTMGTGLGLYISHHQVESLGGTIEVESRVGEGTTFRVLLPQTDKK
jgi:signal transduction histidine kinase/GAF domain-containing protein/AmiR/NasT family two-component response regulator